MFYHIGYFLSLLSLIGYFFLFLKKPKLKALVFFVIYLFFVFIIETIVWSIDNRFYNNALYNLLCFFEFNLLFLFYLKLSFHNLTKNVIRISFITFNILYIISSFYLGPNVFSISYNTFATVEGALIISIVLIFYLREMLLSEEILFYKENITFWVTVGLLLFYLGTMPLNGMLSFMKEGEGFLRVIFIQQLLTTIMHLCFIFGLLWSWKRVK